MLSKHIYTSEYIEYLHKKTNTDPSLLEKMVYAFGMLEAIARVGLEFCFKGGTSLLLLLDNNRRLSTDIDIVVKPGTDIDKYIKEAKGIFPFVDVKESIRRGKNGIEKRHFNFLYHSPRLNDYLTIILDVVFEDIKYKKTIKKPIDNHLIETEGDIIYVQVPDINSLLGDKLTAFAPRTTGIPFGVGKEMEIIKQLFDCVSLFEVMSNYQDTKETYKNIVLQELKYRGLSIRYKDVLEDTINSCLCIASRGIGEFDDYHYFSDGISRIRGHIIDSKFNGEIAGAYASKILYLASAIYTEQKTVIKDFDSSSYKNRLLKCENPKRFNYLKIVDVESYCCLIEAFDLLKEN